MNASSVSIGAFGPLLMLFVASTPGSAQERPDTSRLVPVVVTATRAPAAQAVATTTATRLDGEVLRERGIRLVSDALREVPGLTITRGGSEGAVTSAFVRGGESDYLQVLVDGVIINEPGGAIDLANLTTEDIDRIEIVRGPASVLYGSEAVSGVVQIFTRRGTGVPRLALGARGGSRGTRDANASVSGQAGLVQYTATAADMETDGIFPFNNQHRSTSVGASLGTVSSAATDFRVTGRYTDARYHFPTTSGGVTSDSNQFSFERRLVTGVDAARRLGTRATAHVALSASELDAGTDDDPDNAADTSGAYASRSTRKSARQAADVRLDLDVPGRSTLSAGIDLDWERERTTFSSEHGTFGPYRAPVQNERRWNRGYYGQLLGDISPRLSYTAGARLDENERFGTFLTYRLGAGMRVAPLTTLRGAFGTAFKSPIFYEITGAGFAEPNPDIRPERSHSWDVGVEHGLVLLGREAMIGATYFDQRFRDMIQYVGPVDGPGLGQYRNLARASASGLELEARGAATDRLTIQATTTFLETRVLEGVAGELAFDRGERLIRRPRLAGSAGATYRFARGATIGGNVSHVGRRDDVDFTDFTRVTLPSYTLVGANATLPIGRTGPLASVVLRASAENLLGTRYSSIAGFPGAGRTVLVGASAVIAGR